MVALTSLNPQQRLAAETIRGPVLILAGAGTGKTRVITFRIAHMLDRGISPAHILAVTFTNKAAREMKERIAQLVPKAARRDGENAKEGLTLCTFHSLGVRILRQHIEPLGYKKNFVIYNDSEQLGVIKKILSHISQKGVKVDPREVLTNISRWKNGAFPKAGTATEELPDMAQHILGRYTTALRACNAVDFDDLILLPLKLLAERPDVLEACRSRFRYIMVDEYQDTNAAQFQFVHLLAREHRNLCVVGDDDQSIYGWRGAEISNLLDLEVHYPEVKVVKLEQNYRSTNTILNAANAVIKHNTRRRLKQLWSGKGEGEKITIYSFTDEEAEARSLVERIEFVRLARRIPWSDQAILFRTNIQSRPLETELRKANVRYNLIGGQSFFDRREIKDLMAYLKVLINPHDDNSLLRIANVPARGLSDSTMEQLLAASHERHCSVFTAMQHTDVQAKFRPATREALTNFLTVLADTRAQLSADPALSLRLWSDRFLTEIDYFNDLRRSEKNVETAENRVRNLKDLIELLDEAGPGSPSDRLLRFLDELNLDSERAEEKETAGNAVTLITMHSCKGLEFPHVHVVGMEEGLLPHSRSKVEGTIDEERRLFYVAITRAMKTLTLSFCAARKKYGQALPCHPSSFLKELPENLVEWADEKATQPVTADTGKDLFAAMRSALE